MSFSFDFAASYSLGRVLFKERWQRRADGYTLIEFLLVLVVTGVLYFVGLPAYENSILKSNRAVGRATLMEVKARQEQYFINHKAYSGDLSGLGYATDPFYVDQQADETAGSSGSIYRIDLQLATLRYTVSAKATGRQKRDDLCEIFMLTSAGVKSVGGGGNKSECW